MKRFFARRQMFELLASLVAGNQTPKSVDWGSEGLWRQVLPLAELHRVTAMLPGALRQHLEIDQVPEEVAGFLAAVHELNSARNDALIDQCLDVLATLREADISAVPLKGLAYQLMGLYADDPGQRMTIDIDVLVPPKDAIRAQETLRSVGYAPRADYEVNPREHHNLPRLMPDSTHNRPGSIEVHFRVGRNETDALLPAQTVLNEAQTINVCGRRTAIPNLLDLLDHAVLHSAIGHIHAARRTLRLRDAADINRLWALASAQGIRPSDLRIATHPLAMKYFGACLLLHGHPASTLGSAGDASKMFFAQVLRRQCLAERAALETATFANARLLAQNPAKLAAKLINARIYQSARTLLKSRTV